jgi:tetratricopeptide (TPR) repeat protein
LGIKVSIASRATTDVSLEAHNHYLKGRFLIERRTREDVTQALEHFTKVTELVAPDCAPGWVSVVWAQAYSEESQYGTLSADVAYKLALPAIEKAIQLAPELAEAYGIRGLVELNVAPEKAKPFLEQAIELNPNYVRRSFTAISS